MASLIVSSAGGNNCSRLRVKEIEKGAVKGGKARQEGERKKTQNRKEKEPTDGLRAHSHLPMPPGAAAGMQAP